MTLPTIHLNGTSVESLLEDNDRAYRAINAAYDALRLAGPNGRDYYPQGGGAMEAAQDEHRERLLALHGIITQLENIGEYLATEQEKRRKR